MEDLKQIVYGCIKGKRQLQSKLYKMFASEMYGVCLRYTGNESDAQDLLQEGFVKIFEKLKDFQWKGSLEGWMKKIFIRLALDKYKSKFSLLSIDDVNTNDDLSDKEASALDELSVKEILLMIQQLPEQYRTVFNLYVVEGHSHQEIAEMTGIGVSTSRSNLVRAKNILREKIGLSKQWIDKAI